MSAKIALRSALRGIPSARHQGLMSSCQNKLLDLMCESCSLVSPSGSPRATRSLDLFTMSCARYCSTGSRASRSPYLLPKSSPGYHSSAATTSISFCGARPFCTQKEDPDCLLMDIVRQEVSKGLKEALCNSKIDADSSLKLSVVKAGINAAVKESLQGYNVIVDYDEQKLDPLLKSAIEEAALHAVNKFVSKLQHTPLNGELALQEGMKEGFLDIYTKFTHFVGMGINLLLRQLSLIKDQTKPKEAEDFIKITIRRLARKFLSEGFLKFVDKAWVVVPYVAGVYLIVLGILTMIESEIPPWEYPAVLNCYRVHGLTSVIKFYKEEKAKKKALEEVAAAKKKALEEAAAAEKKKAMEEVEVAAAKKKALEEAAAAEKKAMEEAEVAAAKKKALEEAAAAEKKAMEEAEVVAAAKKKAMEEAAAGATASGSGSK